MILELWHEFEDGETRAALLVQQIDKLDCMQQAVIYEERTGKNMGDFMELKEKITLPELKPLLDACLAKYKELQLRRQADITIIFVSGTFHQYLSNMAKTLLRRAWCGKRHTVRAARRRVRFAPYISWRFIAGGNKESEITLPRLHHREHEEISVDPGSADHSALEKGNEPSAGRRKTEIPFRRISKECGSSVGL
jgi:hypothetical protein